MRLASDAAGVAAPQDVAYESRWRTDVARSRLVLLRVSEGAMDDREELSDAELEEWYRVAGDQGGERNIGAVARDRKIRRLIEELRRARAGGRMPESDGDRDGPR